MSQTITSHFVSAADGGVNLQGSRCRSCGTAMFPKRLRCVACFGPELEDTLLPRSGEVRTFTTVRQAPLGYDGPVPYSLGQVLLGGEVLVLAHLVGKPMDDWRVGDKVDTCAMTLQVRTDGCTAPMTCYAFTPST
jgi:uncharacterized OB-fold protein